LSYYGTKLKPPQLSQEQQAALNEGENSNGSRPSRNTQLSIPIHVSNDKPDDRRDDDGTGHSCCDEPATGFGLDQNGMIVTVNGAFAIGGIKMRVFADESRAGAVEKRGVMEGFGELEEWSAGLEDYGAGVILSFWVRVDSELDGRSGLCG
jgi:hypothetical protein